MMNIFLLIHIAAAGENFQLYMNQAKHKSAKTHLDFLAATLYFSMN